MRAIPYESFAPRLTGVATGYLHHGYAESLSEFGDPFILPRSGGWILKRQIPGFPDHDAMGCYPLFACQDWSQLDRDLAEIGGGLVSLALVTDPFGEYDPAYLRRCFEAVAVAYKEHYVVDLGRFDDSFASSRHRSYARRALKGLSVERCDEPSEHIDEWVSLYDNLIARHGIRGVSAFSSKAFAGQLKVPGIVAFRALHKELTVGMTLWYRRGSLGYYHLGAYSAAGYELRASYALFWSAIRYFAANGLRWLNLGAGAGAAAGSNKTDGLARFKRGWATGTRTAYFCGRVFDLERYRDITKAKGIYSTSYFPAYREGEFY
jgi:hypothetical protein